MNQTIQRQRTATEMRNFTLAVAFVMVPRVPQHDAEQPFVSRDKASVSFFLPIEAADVARIRARVCAFLAVSAHRDAGLAVCDCPVHCAIYLMVVVGCRCRSNHFPPAVRAAARSPASVVAAAHA